MAIGPREIVRSEVEGGLSGPANPIPDESLDCGCGQFPCPRLAKFATRRLFVGLLCWIGIIQSAAYAYIYITSPTIARRFHFDPTVIEWILIVVELVRFLLGFLVAYWGDRIHRAAWTGALVLVQSAGFLVLIIPNFTHENGIIVEPKNVTHLSVYAEDSPELCPSGFARSNVQETQTCYATLALLVAVQILTGMANVAYYALGISYLDDNTRKRRVGALIGVVTAMKVLGLFVGYVLAWGCLKLDSENLQIVLTDGRQMGAWWLGFPILAILLGIPGMLLSWLPRRLPSEVVEQAAASILDLAGRASPPIDEITETPKVGDTSFFRSILRLCGNKILIFNVFAAIFCCTALVNFASNENVFLESRYYVPRPAGTLLGFGDPLWSRIIANVLKPIIIGITIIVSGIVIMRVRPRATSLTIYNVVVFVVTATMIFSLIYATCKKPPIAGQRRGSSYHAGCRTLNIVDNVRIYEPCSCVEEMTGLGDTRATKGPCGSSSCQIGWLVFEIATLAAYSLAASTLVGSLLTILRSVYVQDKALAIGFWMTFGSLVAYVPGKLAYKKIADVTCKQWGGDGSVCLLRNNDSLGNYICYLTAFLLILAAAFEIVLWYFCRKLRLYGNPLTESARETELREIERTQAVPLLDENSAETPSNGVQKDDANKIEQVVVIESSALDLRERKIDDDFHQQSEQLKYGPLGPGDRRTTSQDREMTKNQMRNADTDDELETSSDDDDDDDGNVGKNKKTTLGSSPQVAYRPLELDSDVESDLSSIGPRSRRRVHSGIFDDLPKDDKGQIVSALKKRPFPNPDDYENSSRRSPLTSTKNPRNGQGGFSRTNSFEFSKNKSADNDSSRRQEGDFNEVGIPVMTPLVAASFLTSSGHTRPERPHQEVQALLPRHQKQASKDRLDTIRSLLESVDENRRHRLGHETLLEEDNENNTDTPRPIIGRPPSRDQASSGFGSSPDVGERMENISSSSGRFPKVTSPAIARTNSPKGETTKGSPLSTAL